MSVALPVEVRPAPRFRLAYTKLGIPAVTPGLADPPSPKVSQSLITGNTTIISPNPAGSASTRSESGQPSAGVSTNDWWSMWSSDGWISSASSSSSGVMVASAAAYGCQRVRSRVATVVSRMCSPHQKASTEPSMASQRNTIEASSSLHTSGWFRPNRKNTPMSRMATSTTRAIAANTPTTCASHRSSPATTGCCAAAGGRGRPPQPDRPRSCQRAGRRFQQRPGLVVELRAPVLVEAGLAQGVAEAVAVDVIELQTLARQVLPQRVAELGYVGALLEARLVELRRHDLLDVRRQVGPRAAIAEDPVAVPHVAGHAAELLHLVQPRGGDDGQRVLLAFDDLGLQRRIDLVEVDQRRPGAEQREQRGEDRRVRDADLEPLQVVGLGDRMGGRGDLAEPVVLHLGDRDDAAFRDLSADVVAELAVHRLPDGVVVLEREADVGNAACRHQRRQDRGRQVEEIDPAAAHLGEKVGVGPELVGGEELHVYPAVRRRANPIYGLLPTDVQRVRRILARGVFEGELGRVATPAEDADQRQRGAGGDQAPARDFDSWHCFAPFALRAGEAIMLSVAPHSLDDIILAIPRRHPPSSAPELDVLDVLEAEGFELSLWHRHINFGRTGWDPGRFPRAHHVARWAHVSCCQPSNTSDLLARYASAARRCRRGWKWPLMNA